MKQRLSFLLLVLVALSASAGDDYLSVGLSPAQLQTRLGTAQAPLVVDLRTQAEFAVGHIPGAINVPLPELEERLEEVRNGNGVLIYCMNGSRTRQAEPLLFAHDIPNVYHLEGTFYAWIQGNYPREKGKVGAASWPR